MADEFVVEVAHVELAALLRERARYHQERADEKSAAMPGLKAAMETMMSGMSSPPRTGVSNKMGNAYHADPENFLEEAERDIREHTAKAASFLFLSSHLVEKNYFLNLQQLRELGIVKFL